MKYALSSQELDYIANPVLGPGAVDFKRSTFRI